jgi:quercetin dioxygenase-like cupin family protein
MSTIEARAYEAEDTMIVAWTGGPVSTDDMKPTVVRAENASGDLGARTASEAPRPKDDGQTKIRRYVFPGNSIRLAQMFPNRLSAPHTGPLDNFIYIIDGHVQYAEGGETYQAYGGDFLLQESGTVHEWDQKEGAKFLASSVLPVGVKHRMEPSKAN